MLLFSCGEYGVAGAPDASSDSAATTAIDGGAPDVSSASDAGRDAPQVGVRCATLKPFIACTDFESDDVSMGWTELSDGIESKLLPPGASSDRSLQMIHKVSTQDSGLPFGGRDAPSVPPGGALSFDLMVEEAPLRVGTFVASLTPPGRYLALRMQRNSLNRLEFSAYSRTGAGPQNVLALGAPGTLMQWLHVDFRISPLADRGDVRFDGGDWIDLGEVGTALTSPANIRTFVGFGLLGEGIQGGNWTIRIDNLVIRAP
jgi:hypothetical protein